MKVSIGFSCKLFATVLALMLTVAFSTAEAAEGSPSADIIGSVKTVSGTASVIRNEESIPAAIGDHLLQGDILKTAPSSSMGVIFRDDTILSMGPGTTISIDEFLFDPSDDAVSFLANVTKGTCQFITGQMAKIAPEKMLVETPSATIGIRGTRFLVKVD